MVNNALMLLSLFWFAVQPIANVDNARGVTFHRLLNQLLRNQPQITPTG
jgi:hypothetical protein